MLTVQDQAKIDVRTGPPLAIAVPRTPEHGVECLATLVVTGLGVGMAVDGLQVPFGSLEPQIVILVLLGVYLLFALSFGSTLSLAGWRGTFALLLLFQLLTVLFRELLDFPALSDDVVHGVVHRAMRATVITAGCLVGTLVTLWASIPTRCCSSRGGRGTG
jgi:hypothetical protein